MVLSQIPVLIPNSDKANMATKAIRVLLDPSSGNDLCIRFNKMMILKKMSGKKKTTYVKNNNQKEFLRDINLTVDSGVLKYSIKK